jgi:hypothetical protein
LFPPGATRKRCGCGGSRIFVNFQEEIRGPQKVDTLLGRKSVNEDRSSGLSQHSNWDRRIFWSDTNTRGAGYARRSSCSTINLAAVGSNASHRAQFTCRSEIVDCSRNFNSKMTNNAASDRVSDTRHVNAGSNFSRFSRADLRLHSISWNQ